MMSDQCSNNQSSHASLAWWQKPLASNGLLRHITIGELLLLCSSLALYLYTRLIDLTAFPIYFFCDEAIHGVLARELVAQGFRDASGVWFPPYFRNVEKWSLSLSVYLHAFRIILFGFDQSVWTIRATSVIAGLLAPLGIALILRVGYNSQRWWLGILVLCILPAWFIHSRTAFETALMVACYAGFLASYVIYRFHDDRWIVAVILFGAATFYSYANGQGVMLVSGLLLLLSDARYHFSRSAPRLWTAFLMLLLVLVPWLRFRQLHPDATFEHLRSLYSYWILPIPISEKIQRFFNLYLQGLDPRYWFWPNTIDLDRHRFPASGHLPLVLLPFVTIGIITCLWYWRNPLYRIPLIAILAAPFSSALVGPAITRMLAMVIPATILTVIGIDLILDLFNRFWQRLLSIIIGILLTASSLAMTQYAILGGPLWFRDYGLYGMQYGAQQIFAETIPTLLARDPHTVLRVSPTWANNPNSFVGFFLTPAQQRRVELISIEAYLYTVRDLNRQRDVFIMTDAEYSLAQQSGKFIISPPEQIVPYPDGRPGFYVVRMEYVANIEEILAAERAERQRLIETPYTLDGQPITVAHSLFDMGSINELFDGNPMTLARGFEANPLVIELRLTTPKSLRQVELTLGSMDLDLTVVLTTPDGVANVVRQQYRNLPPDPTVQLDLPAPTTVQQVRLEIFQVGVGEPAHVHVREIVLR
jgi:hypothetical protein